MRDVLLKKINFFYDFFSARPTTAGKLQKLKYLISNLIMIKYHTLFSATNAPPPPSRHPCLSKSHFC